MHIQLANLPAGLAVLLIIVLIPAMAICGLVILRRRVGFETLVVNNEVAGFKYATLGVAYAVLATFLLVTVWEKFADAETAVGDEATAVSRLFRLAETLPPDQFVATKERLVDYINLVIDTEVPRMQAGGTDYAEGSRSLDTLGHTVLQTANLPGVPAPILDHLVAGYVDLIQARQARIQAAEGSLPEVLWWLVVVGGLITVCFTFFFASPNVLAQAAMTGLLGVVIMSLVFATVMLNHPFVGDVAVDLAPFEATRTMLATDPH